MKICERKREWEKYGIWGMYNGFKKMVEPEKLKRWYRTADGTLQRLSVVREGEERRQREESWTVK